VNPKVETSGNVEVVHQVLVYLVDRLHLPMGASEAFGKYQS